ncbi:MAG: hypothetical protein H0U75_01925 [Legionella sp.]|nr:hypothetical protein [Legionella sp.]
MKIKQIPLGLLTIGASVTLGLLSFAGMFAFLAKLLALGIVLPVLPIAIGSMVLAILYESEIFHVNIKGAAKQMFKKSYFNHLLAKEYLLEHTVANIHKDDCPEFFKDYAKIVQQLSKYAHKGLEKQSKLDKKAIEKTLKDMENVLALALFAPQGAYKSGYCEELSIWLRKNGQQQAWQTRLKDRLFHFGWKNFGWVNIFCLVAGLFSGLGMPFLFAEFIATSAAFITIPFAVWMCLLPCCMVGTCMVTYYSLSKFINHDTIKKWFNVIAQGWSKNGLTFTNVTITAGIIALLILALGLTLCTGGTWMTVASSDSLVAWVKRLPTFILGVLNPIVVTIYSGIFNIQNIAETLDMLKNMENPFISWKKSLFKIVHSMRNTENWFQRVNPFRIILKITFTPLRIILFLGHLASIAACTDRVPGFSEIWAFFIALINECLEDGHYFFKEAPHIHVFEGGTMIIDHGDHVHICMGADDLLAEALMEHLDASHSHNHDTDIPTQILRAVFSPLYLSATLWDWGFGQLNVGNGKVKLTFIQTFKKQMGIEEEKVYKEPVELSKGWLREQANYRVEKFKTSHFKNLFGKEAADAKDKITVLNDFQKDIKNLNKDLQTTLTSAVKSGLFNQNRSCIKKAKVKTQEAMEALIPRVFTV